MANQASNNNDDAQEAPHRSFDEMTKEQIAIYAKELNEQFRKERELRVSLQERDAMLDQRAREVSALNHLLQEQLLEWHQFADDYRDVLLSIREMLDDGEFGSSDRVSSLGQLIDDALANQPGSEMDLAS